MKRIILAVTAAVLVLSGCKTPAPKPSIAEVDTPPGFVESREQPLAARFPVLKPICDAAGGCQNVEIVCEKYDGSGNSNIRNTTFYHVRAKMNGKNFEGTGWTDNSAPNCHKAIAQAAEDLWSEVNNQITESGESKTQYSNKLPCDGGCFK